MINNKVLLFAMVINKMEFVYLTRIEFAIISGYCGRNTMCDLASYVENRGYTIEFLPSPKNTHTCEFLICLS